MRMRWSGLGTAMLVTSAVTLVGTVSAAEPPVARVPGGVVAAHLVGRVVVAADATCEVVGYYAFIDGLGRPFTGEPSERTALFSVRSAPFRLRPVQNGTTVHLLGQPATGDTVPLNVYFDPDPDRDYADLDSFSRGTLVATFHPRGGMVTLTSIGSAVYSGSLDLVSSVGFSYEGRTVDIRLMGDTVTAELQGEAPVAGGPYLSLSFPFGGPVLAAGDHPIMARGLRSRVPRGTGNY
jgi:hypothetical protein